MSPRRKGVLALAVMVLCLGVVAIGVSLRRTPEAASVPQPDRDTAARLKLQGVLRDASLLDLIRNARVAARKGDRVTHDAMVTGLRREPQRARTLISSEITASKDSADISILNRMIEELP